MPNLTRGLHNFQLGIVELIFLTQNNIFNMRCYLVWAPLIFVFFGGFDVCAQSAKPISLEDALTFEKSLKSRDPLTIPVIEKLFTQPVNKKMPCKLPTTADQLARSNFRAYWDGQCKNGFAFGLGRDIAISDTHHVEEITTYDVAGNHTDNSAGVFYDFVKGFVSYHVKGPKHSETVFFNEYISNTIGGLNLFYEVGKTDKDGHRHFLQFSPFMRWRTYYNVDRQVAYKFGEDTLMAFADQAELTAVAEVLDPKTNAVGGVALVKFGKERVDNFLVEGDRKSPVIAPAEYAAHLNSKLTEVNQALTSVKVDRAQQMEREYLYFACNGKHSISGLDKETATKICTWRDQFKAPYESAANKYRQEVEQLKRKTELAEQQRLSQQQQIAVSRQNAEQQRIVQQQLAAQQEALNRQQSQQEMRDLANGMSQWGQQMQYAGQQMLQSVRQQSNAPQFVPFSPFGGSRINCVTISPVTSCR